MHTTIPAPPAPADRVPALAIAAECLTCGALRTGPFCSACGQAVREGRLSLRGMAAEAVSTVADLDRGFLHTAVWLFRDPARVVGDYVAGRTVNYTGPARYFVILLAAVVLVFARLDYASLSAGLDLPDAARVNAWITAHMNLFMAATVPFSAAGSWLIFRKAGMNFAEHVVFNLYVYGQQFIAFVVLAVLGWAAGLRAEALAAYTVLSMGYWVWAAASVFRMRWKEALLRTLALQVVNLVAGGIIGAGAAVVLLDR